jgi:hypothetical protein
LCWPYIGGDNRGQLRARRGRPAPLARSRTGERSDPTCRPCVLVCRQPPLAPFSCESKVVLALYRRPASEAAESSAEATSAVGPLPDGRALGPHLPAAQACSPAAAVGATFLPIKSCASPMPAASVRWPGCAAAEIRGREIWGRRATPGCWRRPAPPGRRPAGVRSAYGAPPTQRSPAGAAGASWPARRCRGMLPAGSRTGERWDPTCRPPSLGRRQPPLAPFSCQSKVVLALYRRRQSEAAGSSAAATGSVGPLPDGRAVGPHLPAVRARLPPAAVGAIFLRIKSCARPISAASIGCS